MKASTRIAVLAAVVPALAGCGIFKSSGMSDKYNPNDPNRVVARAVANVTEVNNFNDAPTNKGTFKAVLYDANGQQFYGPAVTLDGTAVTTTDTTTSTIYEKTSLDMAVGQTFAAVIQGHGAVSPPVLPPMLIAAPLRATGVDSKGNPTTLAYFDQNSGSGVTVHWTGGDSTQPVYIQVVGNFANQGWRRIPVVDDPQQTAQDPENFGLAIPNTGTFTIPAQLTERYVQTNGQVATRTITTFENTQTPNTTDPTTPKLYVDVYVLQRATNVAAPVSFSTIVGATAKAGIKPAVK
ncbi:MAG TPA: hypothetical protein VGM37_05360 [Armatimonadota bacterium]|jgi:hypothetical protein